MLGQTEEKCTPDSAGSTEPDSRGNAPPACYNPLVTHRNDSLADRFIASADNALRTLFAPPGGSRPNPGADRPKAELSRQDARHVAGLMRINHSGEVAAQGLYQGHAVVARDPAVAEEMHHAAEEETDHLRWCAQRLQELDAAPSRLAPVWYAGAWTIGALSGLAGDRWSLGFIAETERQVVEHLNGHLDRLPVEDERSRAILRRMAEEEAVHGAAAAESGGNRLPAPVRGLMRATAKVMTRTAYWF